MKIVMLSFNTDAKGNELKPGDVTDKFDDAEANRLISVGGARLQTAAEVEAEAKAIADAAAAAEAKAIADAAAAAEAKAKADAEAAAKLKNQK